MAFTVDLADYVLGTLAPHDLPEVALRALMEGLDSPMLAALAGVTAQTYNRWEVEGLLLAALRELHLVLPDRRESVQLIIDDALRLALAGKSSPSAAVSRIVNGAYYASGANDSRIVGDALGIEEIVAIYWAYDERDQPWSRPVAELDRDAFKALEDLAQRRSTNTRHS